jgi:predicted RNA-binding Zn-ribbon protein involved in translation (DUF1610 family)
MGYAARLTQPAETTQILCKVCGTPTRLYDRALVLRKHSVQYFLCPSCGFMQTESPYWLEEAYSAAIASQDVGILGRNLRNEQLTAAVLTLLFPHAKHCVDYGAGHGIFVRLMRDRGFNFSWCDLYASNDYARGFEYHEGDPCEFLTAFEVLEHFVDPVAELATMMSRADNVFVSTILLPKPVPRIADWWYYTPTSGQHVSFYTPRSLQILAARFDRTVLSHGAYHLFTRTPKSHLRFEVATRLKSARIVNMFKTRPSLVPQDHRQMIG